MTHPVEISWQAPEFDRDERTPKWYLWSIGATLLCVAVALFQANLLFAIFAVLAEITVLILGKDKPRQNLYVVNSDGLFVNNDLLRAREDIGAFAVHDMGGRYLEMVFRPSKKFHRYTRVLAPRERIDDIVVSLARYFPVFEYEGGLGDVINKHLGI